MKRGSLCQILLMSLSGLEHEGYLRHSPVYCQQNTKSPLGGLCGKEDVENNICDWQEPCTTVRGIKNIEF